jgi:hypothetical protein
MGASVRQYLRGRERSTVLHYTMHYTKHHIHNLKHHITSQSRTAQHKPNTTDPKITNSTQRNATHARTHVRLEPQVNPPGQYLLCSDTPQRVCVGVCVGVYLRLPASTCPCPRRGYSTASCRHARPTTSASATQTQPTMSHHGST